MLQNCVSFGFIVAEFIRPFAQRVHLIYGFILFCVFFWSKVLCWVELPKKEDILDEYVLSLII